MPFNNGIEKIISLNKIARNQFFAWIQIIFVTKMPIKYAVFIVVFCLHDSLLINKRNRYFDYKTRSILNLFFSLFRVIFRRKV